MPAPGVHQDNAIAAASLPSLSPLHLDESTVRNAAIRSIELGLKHMSTYSTAPPADRQLPLPASPRITSAVAKVAMEHAEATPPEHPAESMEALLAFVQSNLTTPLASGFNAANPAFLAYVCGGVLPQTNVLDFYTSAIDAVSNTWYTAPLLNRLEANVIHWFAAIVGYPRTTAYGFFSEGASSANLNATVVARQKRFPTSQNLDLATMYCSSAAHFCVPRAARIAGIPPSNCRLIPTDPATGSLSVAALDRQLEADVADGLVPFLLVATIGTTSLGAVDDVGAMAALATQYQCHLHCDGALGGFFLLTERGRAIMPQVALSDSVCFDFHKGMALPSATSLLVVKDRHDLVTAFAASDEMDYLPVKSTPLQGREGAAARRKFAFSTEEEFNADFVSFADCSPDLSRAAKGLKVWWTIKVHGLKAWRGHFDHLLDVAQAARVQLAALPGVAVTVGHLHVVTFRLTTGATGAECNAHTDDLVSRVNARKIVYLSLASTVENGDKYTTGRACFQHHNVSIATVSLLMDELRHGLISQQP